MPTSRDAQQPFMIQWFMSDENKQILMGYQTKVLACDPGKSGALAYDTPEGMVAVKMKSLKGSRRALYELIRKIDPMVIFIEEVHSMPGQGVVSCFTFGREVEKLEMCAVALDIPYKYIRPRVWTEAMCIGKSKDYENKRAWKKKILERAQALFPEAKPTLDVADALMIHSYAVSSLQITLPNHR